jgi:hypothetical protein
MDLQNVEAVVRRLFSDSEFRAAATANPSAALAGYELAREERIALTSLCSKMAEGDHLGASPSGTWW